MAWTSSFDGVNAIGCTKITVGLSTAVWMQPSRGQIGWQLKFMGGGTMGLLPPAFSSTMSPDYIYGTTMSSATLFSLAGTGYFFGNIGSTTISEVLPLYGPCSFYLLAQGATSFVSVMSFFNY